MPETSTTEWLKEHAPEGARIGYDPWLHTRDWVKKAKEALASRGAELVAGRAQPDRRDLDGPARGVEGASGRPARPICRQVGGREAHRDRRLAGQAARRRGGAVGARFDRLGVQHPRRGRDPHAGRAGLCAGPRRRHRRSVRRVARRSGPTSASISATASGCTSAPSSKARSAELKGKTVVVDPERAVAAIFEALDKAGAKIVPLRDPTILPKAIKNPAEIAGQKAAQERDGAAISRFLHWIDEEAPKGDVDELKASDHLEALRRENPELRDLSFDSISGAGPNGAIVHYKSSEKTNRKLETGHALPDRFGRPICRRHHRHHPHRADRRADRRRCATASPACSRAISRSPPRSSPRARAAASSTASPAGRCGKRASITPTAPATASAASSRSTKGRSASRRSAARRAAATSRCRPGMILSNEPGYYKTGEYGIRIENLVLVVAARDRGRGEGDARLRDA